MTTRRLASTVKASAPSCEKRPPAFSPERLHSFSFDTLNPMNNQNLFAALRAAFPADLDEVAD